MDRYIWESECNIQDILNTIVAYTDEPNVIDRNLFNYKTFEYKHYGVEGYRFTLWFHYAWNRASYQPAPLKGVIKTMKDGCIVECRLLQWVTIVDSIFLLIFIAVCYAVAISAPMAGFSGAIGVCILFTLLATGLLVRFLYTRKKWIANNILLDIVDFATKAKRKQGF